VGRFRDERTRGGRRGAGIGRGLWNIHDCSPSEGLFAPGGKDSYAKINPGRAPGADEKEKDTVWLRSVNSIGCKTRANPVANPRFSKAGCG
jgi:hypothetical protein